MRVEFGDADYRFWLDIFLNRHVNASIDDLEGMLVYYAKKGWVTISDSDNNPVDLSFPHQLSRADGSTYDITYKEQRCRLFFMDGEPEELGNVTATDKWAILAKINENIGDEVGTARACDNTTFVALAVRKLEVLDSAGNVLERQPGVTSLFVSGYFEETSLMGKVQDYLLNK